MKEKVNKNTKQNLIYVILSISIIIIIYLLFQFAILLKKPTNSVIVRNGRLINNEEVVGYVIRDEELIDTSEYYGERQVVVSDASRVAKNSTIVSYIVDDQNKIEEEIAKLDVQIQNIMETQETMYLADVKNIDANIQENLYSILQIKNSVYNVSQIKKEITKDLEKKANIIGEKSPTGSKLNSLIEERMNYETKLNESKKDLISDEAGLISYRIDGYENVLTPNVFSKLTISDLNKIKVGLNQIVPIDEEKVKLINNFYTYIAVPMNSKESENLKLNSVVKISFDGNFSDYDKATVEYISDEGDNRLVILKTTNRIEMLTQYRKLSFNIIWWNYEGLKVPNSAIYDVDIVDNETGTSYVNTKAIKVKGIGAEKEVWIKVENTAGDFSIIENYKDEELIELGVPENIVDERNLLKVYDEVILN